MTGRKLTLNTLRRKGACDNQVSLAKKLFGKSALVTPELCESVADKFDWGWAAIHLLSKSAGDAYWAAVKSAGGAYNAAIKPAGDAYWAAVKSAEDAYRAAVKSAGDACNAAVKPDRDAYWAAVKSVEDAYDAAVKPARDAFNVTRARAFAEAYVKDGETEAFADC